MEKINYIKKCAFIFAVEGFLAKEGVFDKLKACDHAYNGVPSLHHEEGSVYNHTMMVVNKVREIGAVSRELIVSAFVHDYGKVFTRQIKKDKNKVVFYDHHKRGVSELIHLLIKMKKEVTGYGEFDIKKILKLVHFHMVFDYNLKKINDYAKMFDGEEYGVDFIEDMFALAQADNEGRITESDRNVDEMLEIKNRIIEIIENNNEEKIVFEDKPFIEMLIGVPYSGKSTYIKNRKETIVSRDEIITILEKDKNYTEAFKSVDQELVDKIFKQNISYAFNKRKSFIVDKTNLTKKSRRKILSSVPKNWIKKATIFLVDTEIIEKRKEKRKDKFIPDDAMATMLNSLTFPDYSEFDEIKFIIG